jgi:hypothetical protein
MRLERLMTRDTVIAETPACLATSWIVLMSMRVRLIA